MKAPVRCPLCHERDAAPTAEEIELLDAAKAGQLGPWITTDDLLESEPKPRTDAAPKREGKVDRRG